MKYILFIGGDIWEGIVMIFLLYFLFKVFKFNVYVIYGLGFLRIYEVLYLVLEGSYIDFDL